MRASFFAVGAGIAHHRDLGVVDMRQIAPTVAGILHVAMPTAKATPLQCCALMQDYPSIFVLSWKMRVEMCALPPFRKKRERTGHGASAR